MDERLDLAIENNIFWCDTVIRAHELPTELTAELWYHAGTSVPFYPRLVTRTSSVTNGQVEWALSKLALANESVAIKDSRAQLNLDPKTYEVLFDSHWIALRKEAPVTGEHADSGWTRVATSGQFDEWCSRWAQFSQVTEEFARGLFKPGLWTNQRVGFLSRRLSGHTVAVAATFEDANAVGVSNVMSDELVRDDSWLSLTNTLRRQYGHRLLVGYEQGADLDSAVNAGFEVLGPLRVWIKKRQPDA